MSQLTELRQFPRIKTIDKYHAVLPQSQLIPHLLKCSLDVNTYPGIDRPQAGLREALNILTLSDELVNQNREGVPVGSLIYGVLAQYADVFGLLSSEDLSCEVKPETKIYPAEHFDDAVRIVEARHNAGEMIGMVHGAFDWAHVAHAYPLRYLYPYTNFTIIMCDPNWLIKQLKEVPGDPRPRIDSIIWRMWQLAILPTVDMVIEAPISMGDNVSSFYPEMYQKLHIRRLGTNLDNAHLPDYQRRMAQLGGEVVANRHLPFPFSSLLLPSSTSRRNRLIASDHAGNPRLLRSSPIWREIEKQSSEYENRVEAYWAENDS